jgi:hypothetical protein
MRFILISLFLLAFLSVFTQKILKLDTPKNPSRMVFRIGSTINFQLDDEKSNWFSDRIIDFDTERGWVIFERWHVHYKDITAIRRGRGGFVQRVPLMLQTFGAGAVFFGTMGRLTKDCQNCNEATIVGAGTFLAGWGLRKLIKPKIYRIGDKNILRLLDLTITKPSDKV